ncbi:6-phosphogluconolactonase [Nilaparvata lugens]|uniref:6-phosphogluconolactonase n=1 Tax=Nilaparvata lugens TaxID=108931 RepID=UPI000B980125|nr:6-phosphogluconolactonase [Nilaparvata lugens]
MAEPNSNFIREIAVVNTENDVIERLAHILQEEANRSIKDDGLFKIGLSGGSLVTMLPKSLKSISTEWEKWRFFFCDERIVPFDSSDSTFGAYKKTLIGSFPIEESQFVTITPGLSAEDAAKDYIQKMCVYFPPDTLPKLDVLLLGMGPDGHTCSLFPAHKLLKETSVWVAAITDSPKPPPSRITFTFPVLNNARFCIFPIIGASKAAMVKNVLEDESYPAGRVKTVQPGKTVWILDEAAATDYKNSST